MAAATAILAFVLLGCCPQPGAAQPGEVAESHDALALIQQQIKEHEMEAEKEDRPKTYAEKKAEADQRQWRADIFQLGRNLTEIKRIEMRQNKGEKLGAEDLQKLEEKAKVMDDLENAKQALTDVDELATFLKEHPAPEYHGENVPSDGRVAEMLKFIQQTRGHKDERLRGELIEACGLIGDAGWAQVSREWIIRMNGFEKLTLALASLPDDEEVQIRCMHAIAGFTFNSPPCQASAGRHGAMELFVAAIKRFADDPLFMQTGGMVASLMDLSPENRQRFAEQGGIKLMLDGIDKNFNDPKLVVQGWYAIAAASQSPPFAKKFVEAKGIDYAIKSIQRHSKAFRVREEVMEAMSNLGTKYFEGAVGKGWMKEVTTAMRDSPYDKHLQSVGCTTLATYAVDKMRKLAVENGAVEVATAGLRNAGKMTSQLETFQNLPEREFKYKPLDNCMEALAALQPEELAQTRMKAANTSAIAREIMQAAPENRRIQRAGQKLL